MDDIDNVFFLKLNMLDTGHVTQYHNIDWSEEKSLLEINSIYVIGSVNEGHTIFIYVTVDGVEHTIYKKYSANNEILGIPLNFLIPHCEKLTIRMNTASATTTVKVSILGRWIKP